MRFRCREDMQFGIIYLRTSRAHPSSFEHSLAGRALELVKQSKLNSNTLFATFASGETGTLEYGFDGSVASFQETSEQALKMFDIALCNRVRLDILLEEQQTISEGATNGERKAVRKSQLARGIGRFEVRFATDFKVTNGDTRKSQFGDKFSTIGSKILTENHFTPSQSVGAETFSTIDLGSKTSLAISEETPSKSIDSTVPGALPASPVSTSLKASYSSPQSSDVRPGSPPHGEKSPPQCTISPKHGSWPPSFKVSAFLLGYAMPIPSRPPEPSIFA